MVKVISRNIYGMGMRNFVKCGSLYVLEGSMSVKLTLEKNNEFINYMLWFSPYYKCDGLSVPKLFRWFLPSWDKKNDYYNLAGVVHDALYGNSGFGIFSREECDDIFRGLLRESGISRFKAGVADKSVEWFAKKHFGDDDLGVANLVTIGVQNERQ